MLPKFVYEALPYVCLIAAITAVLSIDVPLAYASGALFYISGSSIWIFRSTSRRDIRIEQAKGHSHIKTEKMKYRLHLPEYVYEVIPFVYIAAGVAAIMLIPNRLSYLFALLLWFAGVLILVLRSTNRRS